MNSRQPSLEDGLETRVPSTYVSISGQGFEWQNHEMIMERLKEEIQPKVGTKETNISLI